MLHPDSVLITGASSGIGRALALSYAAPGMRLALIGRNAERLRETAESAMAMGAEVDIGQLDVCDRDRMQAWVAGQDAKIPFDLAIANAGITTGLSDDAVGEDPEAVRALLATNLIGVLNTVEPLIAPMCARRHGHLAFIGSIAGLRGLPYSPAYCASKAAVHAYAESLRGRLERNDVLVSLVIVGFVKTPLNDSISSVKPFEVSDARAAKIIRRGLSRGKATIAFPAALYFAACLARVLPVRFVDRLLAQFDVKVPKTKERARS